MRSLAVVVLAACGRSAPAPEPLPCPPKVAPPVAAPRPAAPAPASVHDAFPGLERYVAIGELDGIVQPDTRWPTTAELGRRDRASAGDPDAQVRVETRCGANWCADGLAAGARELIAPRVDDRDEARALTDDHAWYERVIQIAWFDDHVVSAYVAESELSGGAHANNALACRTFDRRTGRALRLRDVLPAKSADLVLAKVRGLLDSETAIEELGHDFESGFHFDDAGFRLGRAPGRSGERPELVLCGTRDGTILELRVDAIPAGYLLR